MVPTRKKLDTSNIDKIDILEEIDSIEDHYIRCSVLLQEYIDKYDKLEKIVECNTKCVADLTVMIADLTKATEGLVAAWATANNVQKFIKWISGIGLAAIVITWIIDKIPDSWIP